MNARKPWLAVLLSVVSPGMGLLYTGHGPAAALFAVGPTATLTLLITTTVFIAPDLLVPALFLGMTGFGFAWVTQVVWSWARARTARQFSPAWYNRTWFMLFFGVVSYVATQVEAGAMRLFVVEPFIVPSEAMAPTLIPGDQFFVIKVGPAAKLHRGSVVVAQFERRPEKVIKRIIGLEGERVRVNQGIVELDGVPSPTTPCPDGTCVIERPAGTKGWPVQTDAQPPNQTWTVGHERSFLMGDNRGNSEDSRYLGDVHGDQVVGVATVIWFSWSRESGVRWSRFGQRVSP